MTRRRTQRAHPRRGMRGFSFVEIIITVSLLLIGIAALSGTLPLAFGIVAHDRHVDNAARIAAGALDAAIDRNARHVLSAGSTGPDVVDATGEAAAAGAYSVSTVVVDDFLVPGGRSIVVTVSWTDDGGSRSRAFTTYCFKTL